MLPAPRDPLPPEAVQPDPPPLADLLTGVLRAAGAQAGRAVDGGSGEVLAEVGLAGGDDVPALVQLARHAVAAGAAHGEWLEDLVVTLGRTVHVLRESGGAVLHMRLDPTRGDVAAVRSGLATPDLHRAAEAAVAAQPGSEPLAGGAGPGERSGLAGLRMAAAPAPADPAEPEPADPGAEDPAPAGTADASGFDPEPRPQRLGGSPAPLGAPPAAPEPPRPVPGPEVTGPLAPIAPAASPAAAPRWRPAPGPRPAPAPAWPAEPGPPQVEEPAPARSAEPAEPAAAPGSLAGPELAAEATVPAMRPVAPEPRPIPARRLPRMPVSPTPTPISSPTAQPSAPPLAPPPAPPLPLPRPAPGQGRRYDQEPALVTVDGVMPQSRTGALAVLALPPVAALPRRRPAPPAPPMPPAQVPAGPAVAVLRQAWSSDLGTMRRLLAGLHRLN